MLEKTKELIKEISRKYEIALTPDDVDLLASHSQVRKFKQKKTIIAKGEICNEYYYIEKGMVRQYIISDDQEITIAIANEGCIVCSMDSFYNQKPSEHIVETIEPTTLYCLSYDSVKELISTNFNIAQFCLAFTAQVLQAMENGYRILKTPKAKDRYLKLMAEFPEIVRRSPVKHIASLLQIRPETLSRIRKVCPDEAVWSAYLEREGKSLEDRS